ncbi:MAG: large subunit ribosomal protein L18 [Candidatus Marivariicella framensis]|jgi:large subunit ribosomal protein L18|tara:strand:- start:3550 stop:3900 length:351 start_codon:yes stop_codon:yes gene_type:complete
MGLTKTQRRERIRKRIRKTISGSSLEPRLAVFRSNKEIYAQLIDDQNGTTLATASSREKDISGSSRIENSAMVGKLIAERSIAAGVKTVKFDRGGYLYHGRVKSLADGAREAGLKF